MVPIDTTHHACETLGTITQAATSACEGQRQNFEGRLKKLLLEQTQENRRLTQALQARDAERWQLRQLLQHKDEQLRAATEGSLQTRVSFQSTQKAVSRYLALCVFRAWFDATRRNQARRRLLHTKNKFLAVVVRRACARLCANLQQATNRRTRDALHGLWLHVAGEHLRSRALLVPQLEDVLLATPRGAGHGLPHSCPSPTSEASTGVPPSISPLAVGPTDMSKASHYWMGRNSATGTAARMASTVEASHAQCLSWAVRKLQVHQNPCPFPLPPVPALPGGSRSTCCNRLNQHEQENAYLKADELASQKVELLEMRYSQEYSALLEERERNQDLKMEIQVSQELAELDAADSRSSEEALEAESRKFENAEVLRATLESRLAQEANWRSEAEHRIISMVSCGEALEHERTQLLSLESELQEAAQVARRALELEEQANENLRLSAHAFEEENTRLAAHSRHERQARLKQASSQDGALALARRDVFSLQNASDNIVKGTTTMIVEEAYEAEAAAIHALREAWADERETAKTNHDGIRAHTKMLYEQSGAIRWREQVEAQKAAATQAHVLELSSIWQERHRELNAAYTCAQLEAATEKEACEFTKAKLEECFARVSDLQEELTSAEKSHSSAISFQRTTGLAVDASQQLDELDSYAQLVARLHAEIRWERAEREAADSSLSSLRNSYRLLLERVELSRC